MRRLLLLLIVVGIVCPIVSAAAFPPFTKATNNPIINETFVVQEPSAYNNGTDYWVYFYEGTTPNIRRSVCVSENSCGTSAQVLASAAYSYIWKDGSTFRLIYTNTALTQIRLATSSDGTTFTDQGILITNATTSPAFDFKQIADPGELKVGSTYYLFYSGWDNTTTVSIGEASSASGGVGSYTKVGQVVPTDGLKTVFDIQMNDPNPVQVSAGNYSLFYTGIDVNLNQHPEYLTSSDMTTWTRSGAGPVLWPSQSFEISQNGYHLNREARILIESGIYKVWYYTGNNSKSSIAYASIPQDAITGRPDHNKSYFAGIYDPFAVLSLHFNRTPFTDSSSYGHTLVAFNGPTTSATSLARFGNSSLLLQGAAKPRLNVTYASEMSFGKQFTISVWSNITTTAGIQAIFTQPHSSTYSPAYIYNNAGKYYFYSSSGTSSWDIANGLVIGNSTANTQQHIVVVKNLTHVSTYLDGVQGASVASTATPLQANTDYLIGLSGDLTNFPYLGTIDDLYVWNNVAIPDSQLDPQTLEMDAPLPPVSDFSANVTSGTTPLAVQFTDISFPEGTTWDWTFQDVAGNNTELSFSTSQFPSQVFGIGNFSIKLNSTNGAGFNKSTEQFINVSAVIEDPISANFTASANPSVVMSQVTFTDTSGGTPLTWNWTIDGVVTNTTQNAGYIFTTAGTHTVDLNVSNSTGAFSNITKTQTVVNASGFSQQDLWQIGIYNQTFIITDSTSGAPIPVVIITGDDSQTYTTTTGTGYLSQDAGVHVAYFASTGYASRALSYIVDGDATHTVKLTKASEVIEQPIVTAPKDVQFHIQSFFGAPIVGAEIDVQGISTSTGSWDWVMTLFGIPLDETPINSTRMSSTTDSNGNAVFLMVSSGKYNVSVSAVGYTFPITRISPQAKQYTISANWNESWFASGNDTLKEVNVSVSWVKFNDTYSFVNISYDDQTATTTGGTFTVYREIPGRVANITPVASMEIVSATCTNSTLVNTPTGGASYRVGVNATTSSGENIVRTFTHYFKGAPVTLPGWTSETILWLALFIIIFTAAFAGATHSPQMAVILCVESWVFWAIGWLDALITQFFYGETAIIGVLVLATFITILWNVTEGKAKGKRSS